MATLTLSRSILGLILCSLSTFLSGQARDTTILLGQELIQFDSDQSIIAVNFKDQINQLIHRSDTLNDVYAIIEAHTDDVGDVDYNLKLSERRAIAIQEYLINSDFQDSIRIEYFGEDIQLDDNLTEKGRAMNRRAVLKLFYSKEVPPPVPVFEGVLMTGRAIDSRSGSGVKSTVIISGKDFKVETTADSIGYFEAEVPKETVLKFQAFPKSEKYQPRLIMAKTTIERIDKGIIIELNGQSLKVPVIMRSISGIIEDEFKKPLANAMLKIQGKTIVDSLFTDDSGRFEFEIPERETVRLSAYLKDYFYDQFIISPITYKHAQSFRLTLPKIEEGRRYVAGDILFVGNRDIILPTSVIHLQSLREVIKMADGYCFKIEGHINLPSSGKVARESQSFTLSENRATRVYEFLLENGIEDERICWEGFGNWRMMYPNGMTAKEQMLNRRVEVLVVPCEE